MWKYVLIAALILLAFTIGFVTGALMQNDLITNADYYIQEGG